ncbi:hypothetical protein [Virgibacillus ndiopensis]|uniref:hypothetical protein n=1 Tax=Virgibacillus ndiopensis TaxID=2004408 RepID=UPI000C079BDD|nr:hypothetical protein [Virgibacillus ndiopensis]
MMESNFPFLMEMKDKTIQVFKGGPESKVGKLLYVKNDYLALETKDNNVIYYQLSHLKSVIEDSKGNPLFIDVSEDDENDENAVDNGNFIELLNNFILQDIQVNQGGPESQSGMLLLVRPDYLAISTDKDGVVYYNLEHIKSISEVNDEKEESPEKDESSRESSSSSSSSSSSRSTVDEESSGVWEEVIVEDIVPACAFEDDFNALLDSFNQRWVMINSGGPEKVEGVLVDCSQDYVTLVHHKDLFKIAIFHIKTVQVASTEEAEDAEESSDNDESSDNNNENDDNNNDSYTGGRNYKGPNPFKQNNWSRRR